MQSNKMSMQQKRFCGQITLGNVIRKRQKIAKSSFLIQPINEDEILRLRIESIQDKSYYLEIKNDQTVKKLQEIIIQKFKIQCRYLSYQKRILHYEDKLSDCIQNNVTLTIKQHFIQQITVRIKLEQYFKDLIQIQCECSIFIREIKNKISQITKLQTNDIRLFYKGNQIDNNLSLLDLGIYNNCQLYFKFSQAKGVSRTSVILTKKQQRVQIGELSKKHQIITVDPNEQLNLHQTRKYKCYQKYMSRFDSMIEFTNGKTLHCTQGIYLFVRNKGWVIFSSNSPDEKLKIGNEIMLYTRQFLKIKNLYYKRYNNIEITCLYVDECKSFIVNDIIINPGLSIQIIFNDNQEIRYQLFQMHKDKRVIDIKQLIEKRLNIRMQDQYLYIHNKKTLLKDETYLSQIYCPNILIELSLDHIILKSFVEIQKQITFIIHQNRKKILLKNCMNHTSSQIIGQIFKQEMKQIKYYGVLLKDKSINIHIKIQQIIAQSDFYYQNLQFIIHLFPQKNIINDLLLLIRPPINPNQSFIEKVKSLFGLINSTSISIQRYKQNYRVQQTNNLLRTIFNKNFEDTEQVDQYRYIIQLIRQFDKLQIYYKDCYKLMTNINERQIKSLHSGLIINFLNFISSSSQKTVIQSLRRQKCVILKITSINGRIISKQKNMSQIIFLPYTYFIIQSIQIIQGCYHIHLLEMPSPTLNSKIILWVDDNPSNNPQYIEKWKQQIKMKRIQIIPLTSTAMAKRWFDQFYWLINHLKIQLRLVTDMVRIQKDLAGKQHKNYEAGIDLIQYLFNESGFTTPVLVFSGPVTQGRQNIQRRRIMKDRYKQVTNQTSNLLNYILFNGSLYKQEMIL